MRFGRCRHVLALALAGLLWLPAGALAATTDVAVPHEPPSEFEQDLIRDAYAWVQRGRTELALQAIGKVLAVNPDSPAGLAARGEILLQGGKIELAEGDLKRLQVAYPSSAAAADLATLVRVYGKDGNQLARMRLLARAGRVTEAAEAGRALFAGHPPQVGLLADEYRRILADAQAKADAPEQAHVDAEVQAAAKLLDAGKQAEAELALEALRARHPQNADIYGNLGLIRLRRGEHAAAYAYFERALALDQRERWRDLAHTAHLWDLVGRARAALRQRRNREAQLALQQARAIDPDNAQVAVLSAELALQQGHFTQAQAAYEAVLRRDPGNHDVQRSLVALALQRRQYTRAAALIDAAVRRDPSLATEFRDARAEIAEQRAKSALAQHRPDAALQALEEAALQAPDSMHNLDYLRIDALKQQADAALQRGDATAAAAALSQAISLDPSRPWLRHSLAQVYLQQRQPALARRVMDEGLALLPTDPQMRYAHALVLATLDDDAGAVADLAAISQDTLTPSMRELLQRVKVPVLVSEARDAPPDIARARLDAAERLAGNVGYLLQSVSNAWFDRGDPQAAVAVFRRRAGRVPQMGSTEHLMQAQAEGRAEDDEALAKLLPPLLARGDWSAEQDADLMDVQADWLRRRIEVLRTTGDTAGATRLARGPLRRGAAPQVRFDAARAQLLAAAGDYGGAVPLFDAALRAQPDNYDWHLARGQALAQLSKVGRAQADANWAQQRVAQQRVYRQLALVRLWQTLGQPENARLILGRLRTAYPADQQVLLHAARFERSQNHYARAVALFKEAQSLNPGGATAAARGTDEPDSTQQAIDDLEARRAAWMEVGVRALHKSATDGISTLGGWEVPMAVWIPHGYDGHYFVHVDRITPDAGRLPRSAAAASDLGQTAAWPANRYHLGGQRQHATAYNLGAGYVGDHWAWDVGAVGVGGGITNVVGGVSYQSAWERRPRFGVSLARRAFTGSLLSYVGAHDPITGRAWGGVVASGLKGWIGGKLMGGSASLSASYAILTGHHVRANQTMQLRGEIDWPLWKGFSQGLSVGLTGSLWRYRRDLSKYTWGQGGYYSPRLYASLGVPLEWSGHNDGWSWQVRGVLSYAHSSTRRSPYYPTSARLQQQAAALRQTPFYSGGSSTGVGRSLSIAIERRIDRHLAVGVNLSLDRSAYYAPTTVMIYLRVPLNGFGPSRTSPGPHPIRSYADF